MYSINVFLTFSLSMFGMTKLYWRRRKDRRPWFGRLALFVFGFILCATILTITVIEKFSHGGWITLVATSLVVGLCMSIKRHYVFVGKKIKALYQSLESIPATHVGPPPALDPSKPTAAMLVSGFGGLGTHLILTIFRLFPGLFKNIVFITVGLVDSGSFKGEGAVEELKDNVESTLHRYMELAHSLGVAADFRCSIGTDIVAEVEKLALDVAKNYPRSTFFSGKLVFQRDKWWQRLLHNETAYAVQRRLQWRGLTMVVLPAKVS